MIIPYQKNPNRAYRFISNGQSFLSSDNCARVYCPARKALYREQAEMEDGMKLVTQTNILAKSFGGQECVRILTKAGFDAADWTLSDRAY